MSGRCLSSQLGKHLHTKICNRQPTDRQADRQTNKQASIRHKKRLPIVRRCWDLAPGWAGERVSGSWARELVSLECTKRQTSRGTTQKFRNNNNNCNKLCKFLHFSANKVAVAEKRNNTHTYIKQSNYKCCKPNVNCSLGYVACVYMYASICNVLCFINK